MLNIVPSADGQTLTFTINEAKTSVYAAVFTAACSSESRVEIRYKANNMPLYDAALAGLTLNGAGFANVQEAVTALNAVIGAGFRSAGGTAIPTPPIAANKTYGLTASTDAAGSVSFQWVELNGEWLLG